MKNSNKEKNSFIGKWMVIGMAIGVGIGAALDNTSLGIPIGMALGVGIGTLKWKAELKKKQDDLE